MQEVNACLMCPGGPVGGHNNLFFNDQGERALTLI